MSNIEIQIRLAGGARVVKVTGESPKDAFEQMAMAYEVFNETVCGLCGSTNIRPVRKLLPNGKPNFQRGELGKHRGWTKYKGEPLGGSQ